MSEASLSLLGLYFSNLCGSPPTTHVLCMYKFLIFKGLSATFSISFALFSLPRCTHTQEITARKQNIPNLLKQDIQYNYMLWK